MAKAFNTDDMDFTPVKNITTPYWRYGEEHLKKMGEQSVNLISVSLPVWENALDVVHVDSVKRAKDYFLRHRFFIKT